MTKSLAVTAKLFALALALAAFGPQDPIAAEESAAPLSEQMAGSPGADVKSDSEMLGWLETINRHEIEAADEALSKSTDRKIQDYARTMKKDHSLNQDKTRNVAKKNNIEIEHSEAAKQFQEKAETERASLKPLDGQPFSAAYINSMVSGHAEALAMLDNFIKNAYNPDLKRHLTETRRHVSMHLDRAKTLQSNLQK